MKKLALGALLSAASAFNYCAASDNWILKDSCDSNTFCIHFVFQGSPESSTDDVIKATVGQRMWEDQLQQPSGLYQKSIASPGSSLTYNKEDRTIRGKIKNQDMYFPLLSLNPTACSSINLNECGPFSYQPYYTFVYFSIKAIDGKPVLGGCRISYGKISAAMPAPQKILKITYQPNDTYSCKVE